MARILYVDDNFVSHRLMSLILAQENHQTLSAYDGLQAMERLAYMPVDMVITDINMPGMDGLDLLKKIRSDDRYLFLPVVVVTASGQERVGLEAQRLGANGFLTQPFSSWELKTMITSCLANCQIAAS